jgi:hypothetical protein
MYFTPVYIRHRLYFNFDDFPPIAKFNFIVPENQWTTHIQYAWRSSLTSLLKTGIEYKVEMQFWLSKSIQNLEMGKFMCHLTIKDVFGNDVGDSSRPIVIPYQSTITRVLYSLLEFPFRLLGLLSVSESIQVNVEFMNNFIPTSQLPIESLQVSLGSKQVSIVDSFISFYPIVSGIR